MAPVTDRRTLLSRWARRGTTREDETAPRTHALPAPPPTPSVTTHTHLIDGRLVPTCLSPCLSPAESVEHLPCELPQPAHRETLPRVPGANEPGQDSPQPGGAPETRQGKDETAPPTDAPHPSTSPRQLAPRAAANAHRPRHTSRPIPTSTRPKFIHGWMNEPLHQLPHVSGPLAGAHSPPATVSPVRPRAALRAAQGRPLGWPWPGEAG